MTQRRNCYCDETSVVRTHSGNGPHQAMDRRGVACFDRALVDVGLALDDRLRQVLHDYFAWTTVTTMSHTTGPQRTSRTGFTSRGGRGTDLSTGDGTSHNPPLPPLVVSATRLIS